jgi:hypothetical protein
MFRCPVFHNAVSESLNDTFLLDLLCQVVGDQSDFFEHLANRNRNRIAQTFSPVVRQRIRTDSLAIGEPLPRASIAEHGEAQLASVARLEIVAETAVPCARRAVPKCVTIQPHPQHKVPAEHLHKRAADRKAVLPPG